MVDNVEQRGYRSV